MSAKTHDDPDVRYWVEQFRGASLAPLTGQDIFMIARNVLTAKERGMSLELRAEALARRLGIDVELAESIVAR